MVFGLFDEPDPPDPNPGIIASAQSSERVANIAVAQAERESQRADARYRESLAMAKPLMQQEVATSKANADRANLMNANYDTYAGPNDGLLSLYPSGFAHLGAEGQNKMLDDLEERRFTTFRDAYDTQMAREGDPDARARIASNYARQVEAIKRDTGYMKELAAVGRTAEQEAARLAAGDVRQSETRYIAGLEREAARRGIDGGEILQLAGARAPSIAVASAHASNTARNEAKASRAQQLYSYGQYNRGMPSTPYDQVSLAAGNSAMDNTRAMDASAVAGQEAARGWYSTGLSGYGQAGSLYNADYGNQLQAYNIASQNYAAPFAMLGTAAGIGAAAKWG